MDTYISIAISLIAVFVSIASYMTNKAINNHMQLQNSYIELCKKLQKLIDFGWENNLTSFKFDIENYTFYEINSIESRQEFNNLQKRFYEQKIQVKSTYMDLMENFDFMHTNVLFPCISKENQFDVWLSDNVTEYFKKLDKYYDDLDQIFLLAKSAQMGLSNPNEKYIVNAFYDNVIEIIKTSQALQQLKSKMSGRFKALSVREINLFNDNKKIISNIKKELFSFVLDFGIEDAIKSTDYSKIKQICLDFGDHYDNFINENKNDFLAFLSMLRSNANKNK